MAAFTFILGVLIGIAIVIGLYEYGQYQGFIRDK